jgi:hypothetical protein
MLLRQAALPQTSRETRLCAMCEELSHSVREALFEMEFLPVNEDGRILGVYAIMDDLERAIRRVQAMDPDGAPQRKPLPAPAGRPGALPVLRLAPEDESGSRLPQDLFQD